MDSLEENLNNRTGIEAHTPIERRGRELLLEYTAGGSYCAAGQPIIDA